MSPRNSSARELVQTFERWRPGAAELAVLASLAVRIEPELLRALRLEVAPHLDVGAEADLWFSPLVQARGADGMTFSAEVSEVLQERLSRDSRLPHAWRVIERCHEAISPAIRLEERVAWLTLAGDGQSVSDIEEALAPALVALVKEGRAGLAPWAARALPRLPARARSTRAAWVLSLVASRNLAGRPILAEGAPPDLMEEDLAGALPQLGEVDFEVRREGDLLHLGDAHGERAFIVRIGDTVPRLIEVSWKDEREHLEVVSILPGQTVTKEVGPGAVRLRTLTGAVYDFGPDGEGHVRQGQGEEASPTIFDELSIRFQLGKGESGEYDVLVTSPAGEAHETFRLVAADEEKLIAFVQGAREDVSSADSIGSLLWHSLFHGKIRSLFQDCMELTAHAGRGLRIRFLFGEYPVSLIGLPWESLFWEERQGYLSLDRRTLITRSLDRRSIRTQKPFNLSGGLRILVVVGTGAGLERLPGALQEVSDIQQISSFIAGAQVIILEAPTVSGLRERLLEESFHIFHFIGHGSRGSILLDDGAGDIQGVSGTFFATLLQGLDSLRLVFLNASETGDIDRDREAASMEGIAVELAKAGVPAVVGMSGPVSDREAVLFCRHFYQSLLAGDPVDIAVHEGRLALVREGGMASSFWRPILYLNTPEGKLFERASVVAEEPHLEEVAVAPGPEEIWSGAIDGATGQYASGPRTDEELAEQVKERPISPAELRDLSWWVERYRSDDPSRIPFHGVDPTSLESAGWCAICAPDVTPDILEALRPLLERRLEQAGGLGRIFKYRPGQSHRDFLSAHGASPGPPDVARVPYYVLLIGDPRAIPFEFQYSLDVMYAVGRIWFDRPEDFARYAESVLRAEIDPPFRPRQLVVFGVTNSDDPATLRLSQGLIDPLARSLAKSIPVWERELFFGPEATKQRLRQLLGGGDAPSLLLTASHGLRFPLGHPRQLSTQGALVCQDWPGPDAWTGEILSEHFFSADDLYDEADLCGMITFHLADFSGGTQVHDDLAERSIGSPERIAPYPFIAKLPQSLLSHPRGGALAAVSYINRLWLDAEQAQVQIFESSLSRLLDGRPVGHAMEFFNQRYAELATELSEVFLALQRSEEGNQERISRVWRATHSARNLVVLGDPGVRLTVRPSRVAS